MLERVMLFDTHLHLIYPNKLNYPWLENVKLLNKPSEYESYEKVAGRLGINGCLHMEVDVVEHQIQEETSLIGDLMLKPSSLIKGVISACRPEQPNFPEFLDWVQQNSMIKGLRRVLHVIPDGVSQAELFRNNIRRLESTGLTFDLCVTAKQLSLAIELVDQCQNVVFILDHCGVPNIRDKEFSDWSSLILELSKRQNVFCKISGIIAYGDPEFWVLEDIRPYFEHVISAFGCKRVVWGSDSPVCNIGGNLETWVALTRALCSDWNKDDREAFFWKTAHKIWSLT